jgi:FAD:protein FMN transferase
VAVLPALACLFPAFAATPELRRHDYSADAMGGTFTIAAYTATPAQGEAAAAAAFAELRRLEALLSHYRAESVWSEVNRDAATRPVHVPEELFELVAAALDYSRRSEGAFDITVGPLMRVWGFRDGNGRPADDDAVAAARGRVGHEHVRLDEANRTVRFAREGLELDPGGIGKGYAVDRLLAVLRAHGIERALVSAAGSTIAALGAPPGQDGWPVSLAATPADPGAVRLRIRDESLSTSGQRGRFFRVEGRMQGHILDPRTGRPAPAVLAAVIAPRALDSEAWTKAVLVNGRRWAAAHTPAGWRAWLCDDEAPASCGWVR